MLALSQQGQPAVLRTSYGRLQSDTCQARSQQGTPSSSSLRKEQNSRRCVGSRLVFTEGRRVRSRGRKEKEKKAGGERLMESAWSPQKTDDVKPAQKASCFPWFR